uniref:Uncharacterized protein n=1 Tax=Arion vulgaris TaxID=1028688 RepID=A0A0B7AUC5_9EUPU
MKRTQKHVVEISSYPEDVRQIRIGEEKERKCVERFAPGISFFDLMLKGKNRIRE